MVFSVAHGGAYFVGNGNLKGMDPTQRQVLEARVRGGSFEKAGKVPVFFFCFATVVRMFI